MIDYIWIRKDLHQTVKVSKLLSKYEGEVDSNALSLLWFRDTNRSVFNVSDQEIFLCMEDIQERVAELHILFWDVYDIVSDDRQEKEGRLNEQKCKRLIELWKTKISDNSQK
jgi:hypothetical protein